MKQQKITYKGFPFTNSIMTQCLLKSKGLGTGNFRSYNAFMYANSLVADIRDKYNQEADFLCL